MCHTTSSINYKTYYLDIPEQSGHRRPNIQDFLEGSDDSMNLQRITGDDLGIQHIYNTTYTDCVQRKYYCPFYHMHFQTKVRLVKKVIFLHLLQVRL